MYPPPLSKHQIVETPVLRRGGSRGVPTMALALVVLLSLAMSATLSTAHAAPSDFRYKTFKVPTADSEPRYITEGPDGNLWWVAGAEVFTPNPDPDTGGTFTSNIGRTTPAGASTEFEVNCNGCLFDDIASGPDNTLFVSSNSAGLWTITTSGVVGFVLPLRADGSEVGYSLGSLTSHGDDLWGSATDIIWRYDVPTGEFTEFAVPGAVGEVGVDADGIVWFAAIGAIGRFDPANPGSAVITPVFTPDQQPANVISLAVASDGNVWFTDRFNHVVGFLDPATNTGTSFFTPTPESGPQDVAAGADGSVWFTQARVGNVARVTSAGVFTEAGKAIGDDPRSGLEDALGVAFRSARAGQAESVWWTMQAANKIGTVSAR
jgi:streptogramin lyase